MRHRRQLPVLVVLGMILACCGGLPKLAPVPETAVAGLQAACRAVYPGGSWSVVHTVEVILATGRSLSFLGVSAGNTRQRTVRSILMSAEGVVFFDGTYDDDAVRTHRAIPPLDDPQFATGLFEDVRFMYFSPHGAAAALGRHGDGRPVCRFTTAEGHTTDVLIQSDGGWTIRLYDSRDSLQREMRAHPPISKGFPQRATLSLHGGARYEMRFELVDAEITVNQP